MIPTKTIINCLREYGMSQDFHLRRIMLEAAKRLEANTEVVHGEWGEIYTCHGERLWGYKCSQCEQDNPHKSNYCPNCGAKMDGDSNG